VIAEQLESAGSRGQPRWQVLGERTDHAVTLFMLALTAALAPAYTVRWHVGSYPTTLLEISILLTLAAFVVESYRVGSLPAWRSPLTLPAAIFLVAGAIAVIAAPDHRAALGLYRAYLVEPVLLGLAVVSVVRSHRQAWLVLAGLGIGGAVISVSNAAVVVHALRNHSFEVQGTPPVVIYLTANAVALYLVPLVAVAGSLVLHGPGRMIRVAALAFLAPLLTGALLSFSRGGWMALAMVALGLAVSHRWRWRLLGAMAAGGVAMLSIPVVLKRVTLEFRDTAGNTFTGRAGRLELWRDTLKVLRQYPVTGAGMSGFANRVAPFWNPAHTERFIDPHNIVLNFWVETGLLGLLAFAWIFAAAVWVCWRGWQRASAGWRPIELGVLLALIAILVHGLVDVPYFKNDLSLEFWILVALGWAGLQQSIASARYPPPEI
jgi:O-antigen ligase